ncbi:MAG TPA: hypothetical protein VFK30_08120, partial [Anaerolineae bacterium]|nr:hypothetical protein [Anaerolineae bacterium]
SELAGGYRLSARRDDWSFRFQAEQEAQTANERAEAGEDINSIISRFESNRKATAIPVSTRPPVNASPADC